MTSKINALNVAAALASALALASIATPSTAQETGDLEKCYGISLAGTNSCANSAGTHSCAGQSTVDYDGGEWRAIGAGHCEDLGGKLEPFAGVNPNKPA